MSGAMESPAQEAVNTKTDDKVPKDAPGKA